MYISKFFRLCLLFIISITVCNSAISETYAAVGDIISVPYFTEMKIKFYNSSTAALFHTFDLAPEFVNFPIPFAGAGPNATFFYDGKLFISFDKDQVQGGVLIYNYADIYPTRNANPPVILSTAPVAGIAIHPVLGDLYVAKFNNGGNSGLITCYTMSSGYSIGSAYDFPIPDSWVNFFTGIAFDEFNNLWTGNLDEHRLICFTASSGYNSFYVIGNGITLLYPAATLTGGSVNVRLLSAPEGFAADNAHNLWVFNNNDWAHANNPGEGTFFKISRAYITYLITQPYSGTRAAPNVAIVYTVPAASVTAYYRQDAKFGGSAFKNNILFQSDQGNGNIWKWDISTSYNNTNCIATGINAAYPGFNGISIDINTFPFGIRMVGENIPKGFGLEQNYPNPFNPETKIKFEIPKLGNAKLVVYDILGREVEILVNEQLKPGTYEVDWSADKNSSGIYYYKLVVGDNTNNGRIEFVETKKMVLIK